VQSVGLLALCLLPLTYVLSVYLCVSSGRCCLGRRVPRPCWV